MDLMKQSSDGSAIIDITKEFEHLFARNIIHIAFGEDITHYELDVWMREDLPTEFGPVTRTWQEDMFPLLLLTD